MTNIITSGEGTEGYVELTGRRAGVKAQGRLFKKQILHMGPFKHPKKPGQEIVINEDFAKSLVTNFSNGVCDIVQVPVVDDNNAHVEDPFRNIGQVVDVDYDEKGIYAYIDAREHAEKLGKTFIGASAMISQDYTDTKTGNRVGPTLLHCAVTNRPYITNLAGFDEVIANSAADTQEDETVLLTEAVDETPEEKTPMNLEELLAELKDKHGVDVSALQATVSEKDTKIAELSAEVTAKDAKVVELSAQVEEKDAKVVELSATLGEDGDLTLSQVAEAVVQLSNEKKGLESKIDEQAVALSAIQTERDEANKKIAENEIDGLIKKGRILPKQREAMLKLSMEDRETFDSILPEDAIVALSEDGVTTFEDTNSDEANDKQDKVKYYLELAEAQSGRKK